MSEEIKIISIALILTARRNGSGLGKIEVRAGIFGVQDDKWGDGRGESTLKVFLFLFLHSTQACLSSYYF